MSDKDAEKAIEERVWQQAVREAGLWGVIWAIVRLLVKKRVITVDDLKAEVTTEASRNVFP